MNLSITAPPPALFATVDSLDEEEEENEEEEGEKEEEEERGSSCEVKLLRLSKISDQLQNQQQYPSQYP